MFFFAVLVTLVAPVYQAFVGVGLYRSTYDSYGSRRSEVEEGQVLRLWLGFSALSALWLAVIIGLWGAWLGVH